MQNDPQNIKDKTRFVEAMNGSEKPTRKALEIIFENMQYNFSKIQESQERNEKNITDLKIQVGVLSDRIRDIDDIESDLKNFRKEYDNFRHENEVSNARFVKSAIGVGSFGVLLVLLQIISLIL